MSERAPISWSQALEYEVHASWWAGAIGITPLCVVAAAWFRWKVCRKHAAYLRSLEKKREMLRV